MIDFRLIHDGTFWIAQSGSLTAKGKTLKELDWELKEKLKKNLSFGNLTRLKIRMTFDNSVIPEWMRQYSNHYFNRIVTFDIGTKTDPYICEEIS